MTAVSGERPRIVGGSADDRRQDLWEPLSRPCDGRDILVHWTGATWTGWTWDDWRTRAHRAAGGLRAAGIRPGDRVACLLTNGSGTYAGILGAWLAGATVVSLPLPARGMAPESYLAGLQRIWRDCSPAAVAADSRYVEMLRQVEGAPPLLSFDELDAAPIDPEPRGLDETVFVQYSSGTTGEPRGCQLSARAIAIQLDNLAAGMRIDPMRDVGAVWLPMSHDMGLFGTLLLTYWTSHPVHISTPERFIRSPGTWMDDCAEFGATLSVGPNFALDLASRAAKARPPRPFRLRGMVVGSERVEAATLRRFVDALGDRVPIEAVAPGYGFAEAVLGVTIGDIESAPRTLTMDRDGLTDGRYEPSDRGVEVISAGQPVNGAAVWIDGNDAVGEIVVESASLADGYLNDLDASSSRFTPDGFRTSDHGLIVDGELYPVGRFDDLIIVGGRNIWARDIERACGTLGGVRPGSIAIVERETGRGSKDLVAVAEPRGLDDHETLARSIAKRALEEGGVRLRECVFLEEGAFPRTPSGKVQRFRCRQIALESDVVARVAL